MGRPQDHTWSQPLTPRRPVPLAIILFAYLLIGALFALETPPWQAPDEPAHYNYIRQLAGGALPVIETTDYDEQYRSEAVSSGFAPAYPIEPLSYEDWQPPLYYLLLTPVYLLTGGALISLRLASLMFGVGIIIAAYAIAATLWPQRSWLAYMTAAFVAFLPQHVAILASVNNDSLSLLIIALILWVLSRLAAGFATGRVPNRRYWLLLGLLLGMGFVTKLTVTIMAPVILIAILAVHWQRWSDAFRALVLVALPAGLVGGILWIRNLVVYDGFDPFAMAAHEAVVVGQPRTLAWIDTYGLAGTLERFLTTTFRSFWGQFGWMGVLMDQRIYQLLLLLTVVALCGFIWRLLSQRSQPKPATPTTLGILLPWLLAATFILNVLLYLGYNLTFVQHQGRYLFPSLIPLAIAFTAGVQHWLAMVTKKAPSLHPRLPVAATYLFALSLFALNLWALYRYIVPQLSRP